MSTPLINNPTIEYWPRRTPSERPAPVPLLDQTIPYNLYPIVHLLPSGKLFMYSNNRHCLFDTLSNTQVPGTCSTHGAVDDWGSPIGRTYPLTASSALLPLSPSNNYSAEVMICGGAPWSASILNTGPGYERFNQSTPADYRCYILKPEVPNPQWWVYQMCTDRTCTTKLRRVMPDMVLLVDGSVLILNGVTSGAIGAAKSNPQLTPMIFHTSNHSWYTGPSLAMSRVPRPYHSGALLLHDATVVVLGGNPYLTTVLGVPPGTFPTNFRTEIFVPPYLYTSRSRPRLLVVPKTIKVGMRFQVNFTATISKFPQPSNFQFTLVYPGVSTHSARHGMRNVVLKVAGLSLFSGSYYVADLFAPPSYNIAPPSLYWLHVLDQGLPGIAGEPIMLQL